MKKLILLFLMTPFITNCATLKDLAVSASKAYDETKNAQYKKIALTIIKEKDLPKILQNSFSNRFGKTYNELKEEAKNIGAPSIDITKASAEIQKIITDNKGNPKKIAEEGIEYLNQEGKPLKVVLDKANMKVVPK